jgi:hypothetical protein
MQPQQKLEIQHGQLMWVDNDPIMSSNLNRIHWEIRFVDKQTRQQTTRRSVVS